MTTEQIVLCLLVLGCLPWKFCKDSIRLSKPHRRVRQVEIEIRAVFWQLLVVRRGNMTVTVRIHVPLIQRLQDAIWAALRQVVRQ